MRRRLVVSTIAIVLVVLGALAIPIGLIVYDASERQLEARLEQQATSIAGRLGPGLVAGGEPRFDLVADLLGPADGLRVLGPDGDVRLDVVPASASSTRVATVVASDGSQVVVLTDAGPVDEIFRDHLVVLLMLALGAIVAAAALAAVQARQLARPLERLAARARRIGEGDFSVQPYARTHIPEIDRIGAALDSSSQRVDTMLANERHFTADATHQLRTGIAGIAMRLEILSTSPDPQVAAEAATALAQTDQLNATIDELLAAARDRSTSERAEFDLAEMVTDHADEWGPRFELVRRRISVTVATPPPPVVGTKGLSGQVLDIVLDNALRHGVGEVTLTIDGPAVTVADEGPGVDADRVASLFEGPVDPAAKHGRGLSLARRLAQVDGASLDVVSARPFRIRFQLVRAHNGT